MNKSMLKIVIALLLLSTSLSFLVSCGEEDTEDNQSVVFTTEEVQTENITTVYEIVPDLPEYDCEGDDLYLFTVAGGRWTPKDVYAEELNGEPMNDAVYQRNSIIQEKYNCVIKYDKSGTSSNYSDITKLINAGDDVYDIVMPICTAAATLALEHSLYDLNTVGNIDLSKPWWSAQFTEDTGIGGKNYFANGDVCETFMRATYAVFFNKAAIDDYSLENPYELVTGGEWTYEKLNEMGTVYSADLNGDGNIMSDDNVGLIIVANQIEALYCASGEKIAVSTDEGFKFTGDSERSLNVLDAVHKLFTDEKTVLCISDTSRRSDAHRPLDTVVAGETAFSEGHVLFLMGTMNNVTALRESETDFGIIPIPKADEAQSEYFSFCNMTVAACAAIPITVSDTEKSSIILEEMSYLSGKYYTPAYYDITLKTKSSRDEESLDMLDLIYDRRTVDIGSLYKVGGIMDGIQGMIYPSGGNNFASFIESNRTSVNTKLDEMNSMIR